MSTKIILLKSICYGVLVAVSMCAIYESFTMAYSLYMAISAFLGAGGDLIFSIFVNKNFVVKLIINLLKNVKNIFLKSVSDALEDSETNKKKKE